MDPAPQLKAETVRLDSKSGFQTHKVTRGALKPPRPQKRREGDTGVVQGFGFPGKGDLGLGEGHRVCSQCQPSFLWGFTGVYWGQRGPQGKIQFTATT